MRLTDGSECIVSVKSSVVLKAQETALLDVDVDVQGFRDDANFVANLKYNMTNLLVKNFPFDALSLTARYAFKLHVDCIVISHTSHPLTLVSLATYLALKTTRLPLLVSEIDDAEIEEQPTFSDDWDDARPLAADVAIPVYVTLGVVGKNVLFDPSSEEEQVLENGLLVAFYGAASTPILNMNLVLNSNKNNYRGLSAAHVARAMAQVNKYCGAVVHALDTLIDQDDDNDGTIF